MSTATTKTTETKNLSCFVEKFNGKGDKLTQSYIYRTKNQFSPRMAVSSS